MNVKDNTLHPTASIGTSVKIGSGNVVGAYTVIEGDVTIGDDNWIGPHVTIGTPPQYSTKKFEFHGGDAAGIVIGNRNVLREYTTVHQPSERTTSIGDDCYLMAYCHVSHDTRLRDGVVMANSVQIGGFSDIQEFANIGLSSVLHQFTTIGAYVMIGMGTVISKDIPPFVKAVGTPARSLWINSTGFNRAGLSAATIDEISRSYNANKTPEHLGDSVDRFVKSFVMRNAETKRSVITCLIK